MAGVADAGGEDAEDGVVTGGGSCGVRKPDKPGV
jgi:hypothetical protein